MTATQSGAKTIVYNTRERLISTDPNRAQAFEAQAMAELVRWLLDPQLEQDLTGGGFETMGTGSEPSLRATIITGIRGRPEVGTANLFIEPGSGVFVDNPGPGPDDSLASFLSDTGVQTAGVLTLTPGGGTTRIDVLECQRISDVIETDNRDVFNPATGLFSPASMTKVQGSELAYRIRTGSPGGGFPGVVAGWLPLMVASVPSGATTWDSVTCWDVRPLASDRASGPFATSRLIANQERALAFCNATQTPGTPLVNAEVDLTFNGYRAGGMIRDGFIHGNALYFDPTNVKNQEAGFAFGNAGLLWHVYLIFPFGLPRWVKYCDPGALSPNVRIPFGCRGIPTVSSKLAGFSGKPNVTGVATPAATGLQDPATFDNAVLAYCGRGPTNPSTEPLGMHCDGRQWTFVHANGNTDTAPIGPSTNASDHIIFQLPGTGGAPVVPGPARALLVRLHGEFLPPTPALGAEGITDIDAIVTISDLANNANSQGACPGGEHVVINEGNWVAPPTPSYTAIRDFTVRVPLAAFLGSNNFPPFGPSTTGRNFQLRWQHNSGLVASNVSLTILGWELGP